jgi:hypothetical protein
MRVDCAVMLRGLARDCHLKAVMQDDCYLIAGEGWQAGIYRLLEKNKAEKEADRGWVCDLVPKGLMVVRVAELEEKVAAHLAKMGFGV